MKRRFCIPIFDCVLWVVVSRDLAGERRKFEYLFGPVPCGRNYDALCSYDNRGSFALFFNPPVSTRVVAHEVFHLTHRILDWAGCNFDTQHHEQGALLCGYLTDLVTRELRKWKCNP